MSLDASTLPVSPIFVIAAVGYAAVSALITGPGITEREMANSGWQTTCQSELIAKLETTRRADQIIPQVPDVGGMISAVYPELSDLFAIIPDPNAGMRAAEESLRAAETERLRQAAIGTGDKCSCAQAGYVEDQRLSLA
ncbi:MAG: hypothetical protein L3J16_02715, partial [Anaerolineales bacterium]|nr:hypothetical protein [Anaerolineales bacterium]